LHDHGKDDDQPDNDGDDLLNSQASFLTFGQSWRFLTSHCLPFFPFEWLALSITAGEFRNELNIQEVTFSIITREVLLRNHPIGDRYPHTAPQWKVLEGLFAHDQIGLEPFL
jgi:hypothetical protein